MNLQLDFLDDEDKFRKRYEDRSLIWAIDVNAPPHPEYWRVNEWADRIFRQVYQWGEVCDDARALFLKVFGGDPTKQDVAVLFSPTGTSANRLLTTSVLSEASGLVASEFAHVVEREGGAVPAQTGSALYLIRNNKALISPEQLDSFLAYRKEKYWITQRPKVLTITNPTEDGLVYENDHVRKLVEVAHKYEMMVHLDGARIFLAAAYLGQSLREMTTDLGIDMLALGGSKVGMYRAEASVFLPAFFTKYGVHHLYRNGKDSWNDFRSHLKRQGNLFAQVSGVAAQFMKALHEDFAIKLAQVVNTRALQLAEQLKTIDGCYLYRPVQTNVVMLSMPKKLYDHLNKKYRELMIWEDEDPSLPGNIVVRFIANYGTTTEEIAETVDYLRKFLS